MSALPAHLQRTTSGHLSEIAFSALADDHERLLATESLLHLDECEHCQGQLADAILERAQAEEVMANIATRLPAPAPVKTPWAWIVAAAVSTIALQGARLFDELQQHGMARGVRHARRASGLVWRALFTQSSWMVGLCCIAAAAVLVTALARWVAPPRERT